MSPRRFVIDGTNVVLVHGRARPELRYLLALCGYMEQHAVPFVCFFDANISHMLKASSSEQAAVFARVIEGPRWSEHLRIVPSGTEADGWILQHAKSQNAHVISNDKYRSRARNHRWIWKRRHPLVGTRDAIILETLDLEIPVLPTAAEYL